MPVNAVFHEAMDVKQRHWLEKTAVPLKSITFCSQTEQASHCVTFPVSTRLALRLATCVHWPQALLDHHSMLPRCCARLLERQPDAFGRLHDNRSHLGLLFETQTIAERAPQA